HGSGVGNASLQIDFVRDVQNSLRAPNLAHKKRYLLLVGHLVHQFFRLAITPTATRADRQKSLTHASHPVPGFVLYV
ncbi:MAG: hypothetical protein Q8K78_07590, partial [Planctomycetaceae bacterium]|nr:hypothetical protein [Planctomycetaceae bacterium]